MNREEQQFRRALKALRLEAPAKVMDDVEELFEALMKTVLTPTGERYRHLKRGTTYDVFGLGHANSAREVVIRGEDDFEARARGHTGTTSPDFAAKVLFDRDEVVVYRDVQSGGISIRAKDEFLDGRFALLPPAPGAPAPDPARALSERKATASPALGALYGKRGSVVVDDPYAERAAEPRTVEYVGPDVKYRGLRGKIRDWEGSGYVQVDWFSTDPHRDLPGSMQNVINVKVVAEPDA